MALFRYDLAELRDAAARCLSQLATLDRAAAWTADAAVWEELLLDWWSAEAAPHARVDAAPARAPLTRPVREQVEWPGPRETLHRGPAALLHLTHPTYAEAHPYSYAHWKDAVGRERLEVLLAQQVELGGGRAAARFGRVMQAASELAMLSARAKMIVFSTLDAAERRRLGEQLAALRLASWDTRPWVLLDVAHLAPREDHAPTFDVLEG